MPNNPQFVSEWPRYEEAYKEFAHRGPAYLRKVLIADPPILYLICNYLVERGVLGFDFRTKEYYILENGEVVDGPGIEWADHFQMKTQPSKWVQNV